MHVPSAANAAAMVSLSVLKSANEQPNLAGDLISKTVASLMQIQAAQTPSQPVSSSVPAESGMSIDIRA